MNDFDLFSIFDDEKIIKENIIEEKKLDNCIICETSIEVCKDNISGFYEPILCPSCLLEMTKFLNKK
ncbi:hypothetical protein M0Q97_08680 [Candidatus Dojkabacteria bacterium]|jgi:hypothetical protein|nr:hypothetical protein [Candidatus Dojkabacteria bacterium]